MNNLVNKVCMIAACLAALVTVWAVPLRVGAQPTPDVVTDRTPVLPPPEPVVPPDKPARPPDKKAANGEADASGKTDHTGKADASGKRADDDDKAGYLVSPTGAPIPIAAPPPDADAASDAAAPQQPPGKVITINGVPVRVSGAGKVRPRAATSPVQPAHHGAAPTADDRTKTAAKAPVKPPKPPPNPPRIGPFALTSNDGQNSIAIKLSAQLRLSASNVPDGDGRDSRASLLLRRIRPILAGSFLSKDLTFYLQLSTAPGSLEALDFLLDYRVFSWLRVRAGQYKIPFGNYRTGSFSTLTMADWSLVTRYFGSERQFGLTVHNGWKKPPKLEYQIGLFSGVNARAAHAVGLWDVYGEKAPRPSDLADFNPVRTIHPELVVHVAYNSPGMRPRFDTDWQGGELRLHAGLAAAWDFRPVVTEDLNLRFSAQVLAKMRGLSLSAHAYIAAVRTPEDTFGQREFAFFGGLVQASYLLKKRVEFALRYAGVQVDDTLAWRAPPHAWTEYYLADSYEQRLASAKKHKRTGTLVRDQEVGFGVNVYLIGNSLKWQNDFVFVVKSYQDESETTFTFRSQAQVAF